MPSTPFLMDEVLICSDFLLIKSSATVLFGSTTVDTLTAENFAELEITDLVDGESSEATYCASLESDNYCFGLETTERFHDF